LLLCDCSRALIRAQEYISLVFPKEQNVLDQYNLAKNVLDQFFLSHHGETKIFNLGMF